jgi:hypothetical protein
MVLFVNLCSQDKIYDALIPALSLTQEQKGTLNITHIHKIHLCLIFAGK